MSRAERRRRSELLAAWRRVHGEVCPGWRQASHDTADLVAAGDRVLCRSCAGRWAWDTRVEGLVSQLSGLADRVAVLEDQNGQLKTRLTALEAQAGMPPRGFDPDPGLLTYMIGDDE